LIRVSVRSRGCRKAHAPSTAGSDPRGFERTPGRRDGLGSRRVTTVLFTCAGMRVDILQAFREAGATTIAADVDRYAPALYVADRYALVPLIEDDAYVAKLAELVRLHDVDLIVPLADMDQ